MNKCVCPGKDTEFLNVGLRKFNLLGKSVCGLIVIGIPYA